jgi:ribosomal protein S18 acetylase RimI-like enzyme
VLVDSGLPCDTFNFVCRARLEGSRADERVRAAVAHFSGVGRPFSWWLGPADRPAGLAAHLTAAGLEASESEVAMAADLDALETDGGLPEGLRIRRVASRKVLRDFAAVNAENWTPPDPWVARYYDLAADALLSPDAPQRLYVGYCDGEPVSTAEAAVGGGVAALFGVSTRTAYRRRGFGSALTLAPLRDVRAEGFRTVVLQASADGEPVYARLGFAPFGRIVEYKPRARTAQP